MELLNIGHVDCYIAVHFIPDVDGAISISISSFNEIDAPNQPIQCIKNAIRMLRISTQQFTRLPYIFYTFAMQMWSF